MSATDRALGNLQDVERDVRLFFLVALGALEPVRALIAHHRREPPAADRVDARRLRRDAPPPAASAIGARSTSSARSCHD